MQGTRRLAGDVPAGATKVRPGHPQHWQQEQEIALTTSRTACHSASVSRLRSAAASISRLQSGCGHLDSARQPTVGVTAYDSGCRCTCALLGASMQWISALYMASDVTVTPCYLQQ